MSHKVPARVALPFLLLAIVSALVGSLFIFSGTSANVTAADDCQMFNETGFAVCGKFLTYWREHGGLAQQGFPISGVFDEQNQPPPAGDGKVHKVQYFQRARFEEHLENQPPFDVLLGLLGSEQLEAKKGSTTPPSSGGNTPVPTTSAPNTPVPTSLPPTSAAPAPSFPSSLCLPGVTTSGTVVQACISNSTPKQYTNVTVYGRLIVGGQAINGALMTTTWHYKYIDQPCSGTSGGDGIATCSRDNGPATIGYTVNIDVKFSYNGQTYSASTSFTTQ